MSLLQKIAESQGAAKDASDEGTLALAEEKAMPDSEQQMRSGRDAYSNTIASEADVELGEEAPTGQEQSMFTEIERKLTELTFGQSSEDLVKAIQASTDAVAGVGEMASQMTLMVSEEWPDVSEDTLMAAGETAVELLVELIETAETDLVLSDDQVAEALSIGVTNWANANPEKMGSEAQFNDLENTTASDEAGAPKQLDTAAAPKQATPPIQQV